jgi:hypothetical protein
MEKPTSEPRGYPPHTPAATMTTTAATPFFGLNIQRRENTIEEMKMP